MWETIEELCSFTVQYFSIVWIIIQEVSTVSTSKSMETELHIGVAWIWFLMKTTKAESWRLYDRSWGPKRSLCNVQGWDSWSFGERHPRCQMVRLRVYFVNNLRIIFHVKHIHIYLQFWIISYTWDRHKKLQVCGTVWGCDQFCYDTRPVPLPFLIGTFPSLKIYPRICYGKGMRSLFRVEVGPEL